MKSDLPRGSGITGGFDGCSAASELAMRSAGEWQCPRAAPGCSGWSGGKSGSIGRRLVAGAGLFEAVAAIGAVAAIRADSVVVATTRDRVGDAVGVSVLAAFGSSAPCAL